MCFLKILYWKFSSHSSRQHWMCFTSVLTGRRVMKEKQLWIKVVRTANQFILHSPLPPLPPPPPPFLLIYLFVFVLTNSAAKPLRKGKINNRFSSNSLWFCLLGEFLVVTNSVIQNNSLTWWPGGDICLHCISCICITPHHAIGTILSWYIPGTCFSSTFAIPRGWWTVKPSEIEILCFT